MSYMKRHIEDRVEELAVKYNRDYCEVMDLFFKYDDFEKLERALIFENNHHCTLIGNYIKQHIES